MKRKLVLLICVCGLVIVVWAGSATYTQRQDVVIHQTIDKVAPLFTHLDQWTKWHPDFVHQKTRSTIIKSGKDQLVKLDHFTYLLKIINPVKVYIKIQGNDTAEAILSASPYRDGSYTYVEYATTISGFAWLQHQFGKTSESLLKNLQSFAEDESRHYGFFIKTVPVFDTLILTAGTTTARDSVIKITSVLYNRLVVYCKQNTLPVKQYYYTSAVVLADGNMRVSVGVPVPEQTGNTSPEFEFLKLPANGHLVAGEYKGRYKDKQQLYAAMDEYVQDKHMKKVAQPLEQYNAENAPLSDSTVVLMQLYYPVF